MQPHRRPGYAIVTLSTKRSDRAPGDVAAAQLRQVADWADDYSFGEVRVTQRQNLVLAQVRQMLRTPEIAARTLAEVSGTTEPGTVGATERDVVAALSTLDTMWESLFPAEQQRLLHLLVEQVGVTPEGFDVHLRAAGIRSVALELHGAAA